MQTLLIVVSIAAIAVVTVAFVILVSGLLRETRKIGHASDQLSVFLKTAEEELTVTARDARTILSDTDSILLGVKTTVDRVERISLEAEGLLRTAQVASAAAKAFKSSSAGLSSVYQGVKQGIKALWGDTEIDKEGTSE